MEPVVLLKRALVFGHLLVFAIAVGEIIRTDLRLLRERIIDAEALHRTARVASISLAALWATGLALVYLDNGFNPAALAENPKLVAKIAVVAALTANGAALHLFAFPTLAGRNAVTASRAKLAAALGAISSVSWLYASFVGVARLIASRMTLGLYLELYGLAIAGGIAIAIVFVAPLIERRLGWAVIRSELLPSVRRTGEGRSDTDIATSPPADRKAA